jgi:cytoskeletal protein CcmA (bactofilin family)
MWSDRKDNEDSRRTAPVPTRPDAPISEAPVASAGPNTDARSRGIAVIGKGMVIKGQIKSAEHMHIAGEIEGSLYLAGQDLTVTSDSRVRAHVTAREVDVSGSIQGNVDATRKITVRKGGKLIGDLRTPGIVIEDGAYFKGNIEIVTRDLRQNGDDFAPEFARAAATNV